MPLRNTAPPSDRDHSTSTLKSVPFFRTIHYYDWLSLTNDAIILYLVNFKQPSNEEFLDSWGIDEASIRGQIRRYFLGVIGAT
jgi:hypothetical protein